MTEPQEPEQKETITVSLRDLQLVLNQAGYLPYSDGQEAQRRLNAVVPGLDQDVPWTRP